MVKKRKYKLLRIWESEIKNDANIILDRLDIHS